MHIPIPIKINNIIATSSVEFKLNIERFASLNHFDIDENYPIGVHCRNAKLNGLVTVFRTGKMISVGTNTVQKAKQDITTIRLLLHKQRSRIEIKL